VTIFRLIDGRPEFLAHVDCSEVIRKAEGSQGTTTNLT
jgi:hypothetical protein